MNNSRSNTRRQSWLTTHRIAVLTLLLVIAAMDVIRLIHPAPSAPSTAEIAEVVNGPAEFQRPSAMEYVAQTDSCVVGGVVTSTEWHVGQETFDFGNVDPADVDYTSFVFKSDTGRVFRVSTNGAVWATPGQNLGLELHCSPETMNDDESFGMRAIIYGGL